jgi:predicted RNase H-like HicB family nuclease
MLIHEEKSSGLNWWGSKIFQFLKSVEGCPKDLEKWISRKHYGFQLLHAVLIWFRLDGVLFTICKKKFAANGHKSAMDFAITITPEVHKDGRWYVAFCPEVPEANGQGRTSEESLESLKDGVISIMEDRRQDARARAKLAKKPSVPQPV